MQELKPGDTVTDIFTGETINLKQYSNYVIYENTCTLQVEKSQNLYALIGFRRGSLQDSGSEAAKAIAQVLDEK